MLRMLLPLLIALSSFSPHCAGATNLVTHELGARHHHHGTGQTSQHTHVSDACVGCVTPVRFQEIVPASPIVPDLTYFTRRPASLAIRPAALDPPPPRTLA